MSHESIEGQDNGNAQVPGQIQLIKMQPDINENNEVADEEFDTIHLSNMDVKVSGKLDLNQEILQRAFEMIDKDKDGYVSMAEIKIIMNNVEFQKYVSQEASVVIIQQCNQNASGKLTQNEFQSMIIGAVQATS